LDPVSAVRWIGAAPPAATPAAQIDIVTDEAPAAAGTFPAAPLVGPAIKKHVHHALLLYKVQDKWSATLSPATDTPAVWTFEPSANLIDHLTKTTYEAVTTAPTTTPSTAPAPNP
jgi:hypothetical protein